MYATAALGEALILLLASAWADDVAYYRVTAVVEDAEKFLVQGPGGTFLCDAMTYCFGITEGQSVLFLKDPGSYTNDQVVYGDRSCQLWDCDSVGDGPPPRPVPLPQPIRPPNPASPDPDAALRAYLEALIAEQRSATARSGANGACLDASVKAPNPLLGNSGEVVVLSDGSVWEVGAGQYNYLYAYYASIRICGGKMLVGGKAIDVLRVR